MPSIPENPPAAAVRKVSRAAVDESASRAASAASAVSGVDAAEDMAEAASPARMAKLTRAERMPSAEPQVSLFRHRSLWLPPLLAEAVLCVGAAWLALSLESVMWAPDRGFPALSFAGLVLAHGALVLHSRSRELFMPRSVVLVGVGSLMAAAAGAGVYLVIEGYLVGGLYRLRYMPLVLVPVGLFLVRGCFVFRAARSAPSLSRLNVNARVEAKGMRVLRAKLRYWLRS
jgi:hypothetical protein